jgi:uncharacterized protein (TIGR02186 family)
MTRAIYSHAAFVLAVFAFIAMSALPGKASATLTATANHDHIKIDFFYNGSEVSVRGVSDPGADLVVKITSPECRQCLKKKGKVAGLIWMNVGDVNFEDVPNLYFIQGTKEPEAMLTEDELDKNVIGYKALEKHIGISPVTGEDEKSKWFGEFRKFKEGQSLYYKNTGGFIIGSIGGLQTYYMKFKWPYQAQPGDYLVTVYAVKDGKVVEQATSKVNVEQAGAVKTLANMAKNNGAAYGILAVLAALGAGFGVGLVFGKGGGSH